MKDEAKERKIMRKKKMKMRVIERKIGNEKEKRNCKGQREENIAEEKEIKRD